MQSTAERQLAQDANKPTVVRIVAHDPTEDWCSDLGSPPTPHLNRSQRREHARMQSEEERADRQDNALSIDSCFAMIIGDTAGRERVERKLRGREERRHGRRVRQATSRHVNRRQRELTRGLRRRARTPHVARRLRCSVRASTGGAGPGGGSSDDPDPPPSNYRLRCGNKSNRHRQPNCWADPLTRQPVVRRSGASARGPPLSECPSVMADAPMREVAFLELLRRRISLGPCGGHPEIRSYP